MDGGVSTHLENLLQAQNPPATFSDRSLWSSSLLRTKPGQAIILQGHHDWITAGSDIVTTVTYQCHFGTVTQTLIVTTLQEMQQMMERGVELAKQAVSGSSRRCFVVASSGCYGAALADGSEYTGNYPNIGQSGLMEFHKKKIRALAASKPDGLAMETIPCVEECTAVCIALREMELPGMCSWISLACKDGETLNEGKPVVDALEAIRQIDPHAEYVHAVGINCCDSAHIASLIGILTRDMAQNGPRRGIVLYPNSGEEWDAPNETWLEGTGCTDEEHFADRLMEAIDIVARIWNEYSRDEPIPKLIIGGCCRTSPKTIATLRRRIDVWHEKVV